MLKLFFLNGDKKGESLDVQGSTVYIGRLPDNDVQITDRTVSRKHLKVTVDGSKFILRDLRSKNGTFLKGQQLLPDMDYEIDEGTPFAVGNIALSLGVKSTESVFSPREILDLSSQFSSTAMFTAFRDRPMTPPKNMDFLFKISNIINQSLDINEIMQKVLDYLFELLKRIDRGFVILVDGETGEFTNVISRIAKSVDDGSMSYSYSKTIVDAVIRSGKPLTILDTFGQEEADISESMEMMHVKSVMCVPLVCKEKVQGVLYVDSVKIPYGFREEDLALVTALCSTAAIAIENASLYRNLESVVEKRTSELNDAEKMLSESEKRFRAMFNNLSSGVIILKVVDDGNNFLILDINRADSKIDRVNKKNAIGRRFLDVFPEIESTGFMEKLTKVWKTGKAEKCSIIVEKDENKKSWREYYIYTLPDNELVAIFDDVTEKKQAEFEQKALQEQLFAAQKMESIGAFAGGTAHNFRNILQAISGNVEYLEVVYGDKPEVKELTKNIYGSIDRGVGLINNLLHFAKQGWKLEMEELDLAEVVMRIHEIVEKVFNKNIKIKMILEDGLQVRGNSSLLSQAFMNLFTNARDAMPNGGDLTVKAKKVNNRVIAYVSDTGHGIEEEVIDKIFDPFFTLKEVGSGTGLGLSTTHGIFEQHKGSITVSSKVDKGTTFKITLPISKGKINKKHELRGRLVKGNGQKILIIDDEESVLESISNLVTQLGYKASALNRPTEAVATYEKWRPDLVLIDRNMPEMDGIDCIADLLKLDPDAKIIIISGYEIDGSNGINDDIRSSIKGYLTKPCNAIELSNMILETLGS
ncbi:MAG: ATP-binding protein [Desulfobacteraceae bacterium]|jgi:signal transduction histidine kinase